MLEFFSRRKKRKLIVAGCSYVDDYAKSQNLPTFPLWSDLLADKLNMQLINLGKCRSEEHTSELQSHSDNVCILLLEKKKIQNRETQKKETL